MAPIKDDEESTYKQIEDAFFGILWCLQTQRKTPLVNLNILSTLGGMFLDFCHMLAFFVHSFGWGSITITWGQYVKYIQLQIPLTSYEGFTIGFWIAVGLAVFIALNSVVVGYSFYTKNFNQLWAIKMLHLVVAIVFNIAFLASLYLLLTPWFCYPDKQVLITFYDPKDASKNISCFGFPNLLSIILGTISVVFLIFLVFTSTLASVDYEPVENDLSAVSSPSYRLYFNAALIFMTIDEYFIAYVIEEPWGHWFEALFNLILSIGTFVTVIYYLPFQLKLGNELRGGMCGVLLWAAACSFVAVNQEENPHHENRIIDYVLLAGMIPAAFVGRYIITLRYAQMSGFAAGLVERIDPNFTPEEVLRAKFGTRKNELIVGAERNPKVYLPHSMQIFSTSLTTIEIFGRLMWFESDDKRNHEAAYRLYRLAEMAYPDVAYVKLLRASCFSKLCGDTALLQNQFTQVAKSEPSFSVRFALYRRDMEAKQKGSSNNNKKSDEEDQKSSASTGDDSLDLVAYVEFQKYYLEAQRYNASAIDAIREFWALFLQPEITFTAFNNAARIIEAQTTKALGTYKTLLIRYPKHVAILTSYAYFLELVMHNGEEAAKYHSRADEIKSREAELSNQATSIDGNSNVAAVISISEDGNIESVNKILCAMFAYERLALTGRSIKCIVPSPWKEKHDLYLDNYINTGEAKVIGKPARKLFAQHREGYSFAMNLSIQERRNENGERSFVALINRTDRDKQEGVIIINEAGQILLLSEAVTKLFGYSAVECLRNNVTLLMIDAYAANHDSYLKRYKDTGVAKVIGTAGRNVPARRKDGTIFPAGLIVEELIINKEKFFMANIVDTSNVKATIYMDGFGIIQNVDNGISQLLGYFKEQVVGKNIKCIQPPPYSQYHDMYLERYRKTKISNILKATDGRVLPALHADGSVVQIRAIITRADDETSSNMLFKGTIQRIDSSVQNQARPGFRNENVIEITKTGVIHDISRSILKGLGYENSVPLEAFIGLSIEVIFPPMDTRATQMKEYWMPKFLADPNSNFYLLAVNRNLSVVPVTVNVSMKSSDIVLVRMADLSGIDALITIDDMGTILNFSEDASLLLGHESDEAIGRNIKFMLVKEIADQHDYFLQRYRETRVARVVGIPRSLNTIHRDKSVMPIEIQVTEIATGEGRQYVGRLRHLPIEDKISNELMENLFANISAKVEELNRQEAEEFENSESSSSQSVFEEDQEESEDESSLSSDSMEDDKLIDHEGVDAKLKYIKDTDAEDKSSVALGLTLKILVVIYGMIYVVALIVFNVLPNPVNWLVLMDKLAETSNTLSDVVGAARQLQLQQIDGISDKYSCSWKIGDPNACSFADKNNVSKDLSDFGHDLQELNAWFSSNYAQLRTAGDIVDQYFSAKHQYYDFTNENMNEPVEVSKENWPEFAISLISQKLPILEEIPNLANRDSRIAWNVIIYNRESLYESTFEIIESVPQKVLSLLDAELIAHLIFTIILFAAGIISAVFVILPRLRRIQADRMLILKLVLMVPRTVIFDFVNVMYRKADLEEDGGEGDAVTTEVGSTREGGKTIGANALKSTDITEVVPDRNYKTYLIFTLGLFSLSLPSIVHCAWRLTENARMKTRLDYYLKNTEIHVGDYSFKWRQQDLFATECPEMQFCNTFEKAKENLKKTAEKVKESFEYVGHKYAGDDFFSQVLYRADGRDPLNGGELFCPFGIDTVDNNIETGRIRCDIDFKSEERAKLYPPNFSLRIRQGAGIYIPYSYEDSLVLADTENVSEISVDKFWTTWTATPIEGKTLTHQLLQLEITRISEFYNTSRLAASVTYGFSLALSLIIFLVIFSGIKANLQNESKHNRSILFMIPNDIVKRNKAILDYVDRVFLDLSE